MGWKDFFGKKKDKEQDEPLNLSLSGLKAGYYVDWDLKTWEVVSAGFYDWGGGDRSYEWQLKSTDDIVYLEYESDDEEYWSVSRKISFSRLDPSIREHILEVGDPPEEIVHDGRTYYLEESGGGHYFKSAESSGQELLSWSYEDDDGLHFLVIEQYGENSFEASIGSPVEEYQFTDITPGEQK